jgi:hypothetical protein
MSGEERQALPRPAPESDTASVTMRHCRKALNVSILPMFPHVLRRQKAPRNWPVVALWNVNFAQRIDGNVVQKVHLCDLRRTPYTLRSRDGASRLK